MKQTIKITESELQEMIEKSINEAMINEGWFKDKFNQAKSSVNTLMNNDGSFTDKVNAAKKIGIHKVS